MSPLRRKSLVLGMSGLLLLALAAGCSKQGEGERCDREAAGDGDCESPLICTDFTPNSSTSIQRCCPPSSLPITDKRCDRSSVLAGLGGTGGTVSTPDETPSDAGAGGNLSTPDEAPSDAGAGGASGGAGSDE